MDFQFWIWLIVIVITLIARAKKKKPEGGPPHQDAPDKPRAPKPTAQQKPITFEDLLREIQGEKALSKPPAPKAKEPEYDLVDYDDDIPEEVGETEVVDYEVNRDEQAFETYEAAQREASKTPAMEEMPHKLGTIMKSGHFEKYSLKKKKTSFAFLNELKDPEGFKKAFVMSEILRRKY
ncbi:MAG: hypothetical protein M9954_07310 [Cyclobacteriaceae bacterium]|nr:hypothetical protein [Cyclobacteriaceae bacterium]MCB0500476.1 hypothetical protein [Cyclobacteriaceae bacterium]MCB9238501.1 hypothetical protein [Flammeovirgaceae bacterium]MCO5271449.1 hypothetical protein [Cyclobacteriaceae bacterium]MCW5903627.1 hypothetical protein [Cyclobacteriaceae bacterium]